MNVSKLSLVPLQQASLCLDCDMITAAHTHCFVCGSAALLNLARTLNGDEAVIPMPRCLAAVTGISARRSFESHGVLATESRQPRRLAGQAIPFPQISGNLTAERKDTNRRYSFREIVAAVHRVMTTALIGILLLGAATQMRARSVERHGGMSDRKAAREAIGTGR